MAYEKRNMVVCVLLSFVTCGLYTLFWIYQVGTDLYRLNNEPSRAGMDIVLSLITCGIYFVYLNYKWGKMVDAARRRYDLIPRDDSLLFVLLSIFGFSLVTYCIIQSQLNNDLIPAAESIPIMMGNGWKN